MTIRQPHQRPLRLPAEGKRTVRTQFGALCWRMRGDKPEFLLITSRQRKRWIIPKGWPVDRATPADAAQTEAWEEAGVVGKVEPVCLGIFSYNKRVDGVGLLPCIVATFPIRVKKLRTPYPEQTERRRKWFSRKKAARLVDEPELASIILRFDPRMF